MKDCRALARRIWLFLATVILLPSLGVASPLFPDVRASQSKNGKYLVVVQQTFDSSDPRVVRRVLRSTYLVLRAEPFTNSRDRLPTPARFWSSFGWQVTPKGGASQGVFLPLISDDGQTLVLIGVGAAMKLGSQEAMWIYRENGNTAKLVRTVSLSELWTPQEIEPDGIVSDAGETPMWYTGGSLDFSADGRELLYRSRWSDEVKIRLSGGSTALGHN